MLILTIVCDGRLHLEGLRDKVGVLLHPLFVLVHLDLLGEAPRRIRRLLVLLPLAEVVLALDVVLLGDFILFDERHVLQASVGRERVRVEVGDVDGPAVHWRIVTKLQLVVDHVRDHLVVVVEQCEVHEE